ncbi:MAG: phosphate acetyltransferase [Candidatus Omnitrophota bacterium]
MSSRINQFTEIAKKDPKKIVFPEGLEARILEAAAKATALGVADIILIGEEKSVKDIAAKNNISLEGIEIVDPERYDKKEQLVELFHDLRKHKGMTIEEARKIVLGDFVYFGALLVRTGAADGFVAGASYTTSDVARAAIYCLEPDKSVGVVSSSFIIELEDSPYGEDGLFVFGDCGIVPNPDAKRLAGIAISSSRLYEKIFKAKPRTALLSYSTKRSAKGESVEKVRQALEIIKKEAPDLAVDGELQLDAAIVPEVAAIKAPSSPIAGKANVLIFPNLDAGNIAYKLIQRLGKARVAGPLLQGVTKPCSDLSRGCGVREIVDSVAVTVIRAQT